MNLAAEESAIIDRLKHSIHELEARPWPKQADLAVVKAAQGDLLVQHVGGEFGPPEATPEEKIAQTRTGRWRVVIRHRNLSPLLADENCYGFLERIRLALTGFTVPNVPDATKLYPVGPYGFLDEREGIWFYGMTFAMSTPEVG